MQSSPPAGHAATRQRAAAAAAASASPRKRSLASPSRFPCCAHFATKASNPKDAPPTAARHRNPTAAAPPKTLSAARKQRQQACRDRQRQATAPATHRRAAAVRPPAAASGTCSMSRAAGLSREQLLPPGRDLENGKDEDEDKVEERQPAGGAAGGAGGGRDEVESRATFGGSFQEDAPAPYDAAPPLSRAPSERAALCCRSYRVRLACGCGASPGCPAAHDVVLPHFPLLGCTFCFSHDRRSPRLQAPCMRRTCET